MLHVLATRLATTRCNTSPGHALWHPGARSAAHRAAASAPAQASSLLPGCTRPRLTLLLPWHPQAVKPGTAPLGLHRGEPYYPRAELHELHTAERWRREGRCVPDHQLGSPAKLVNKRKQAKVAGMGGRHSSSALAAAAAMEEESDREEEGLDGGWVAGWLMTGSVMH